MGRWARRLLPFLFLLTTFFQLGISNLHAQVAINPVKVVPTDPSGACPPARINLSTASGNFFYCDPMTMVWTVISGGGGGSGTVTQINTTAPIAGGPITTTGTITCNVASGSQPGCLSAADWTTFNNKQAGGVAITSLTGDVTATGPGAAAATLVNIPTGTTMAGTILATAISAPSTPAAGKGNIYVDSTSKNIAVKDDAGTVKHGVQTDTGTANNYISAISDAGAITKSRPSCATLSDSASGCSTAAGVTTSSPLSGTTSLSCPTCIVASSPGVGIAHFAGSTQTATSSLIVAADITSATITGTQIASSIALAGSPTTTTQSANDASTKIATTAYVDSAAGKHLAPCTQVLTSESTTSTSFTDLATVDTISFTLGATTNVMISYASVMKRDSTGSSFNAVNIDGSDDASASNFVMAQNNTSVGSAALPQQSFFQYIVSLASGAHTIKIRHKVDGGTGTWANRVTCAQLP